ncbi:unnamed protein product, partial [Ectocarpus sp. 12 AP-2014]
RPRRTSSPSEGTRRTFSTSTTSRSWIVSVQLAPTYLIVKLIVRRWTTTLRFAPKVLFVQTPHVVVPRTFDFSRTPDESAPPSLDRATAPTCFISVALEDIVSASGGSVPCAATGATMTVQF